MMEERGPKGEWETCADMVLNQPQQAMLSTCSRKVLIQGKGAVELEWSDVLLQMKHLCRDWGGKKKKVKTDKP